MQMNNIRILYKRMMRNIFPRIRNRNRKQILPIEMIAQKNNQPLPIKPEPIQPCIFPD